MLNFVAWIVAGGALGLLVSRLMAGNNVAGALVNVLAGTVGGFVSGLVVRSALAALDPEMARLSLWALVAALSGAALLLVVVNVPVRAPVTYRYARRPRRPD
jgi:uncharacterized membrane protein YeaQ/YmgE (transglycosylase-associated protein family)